jgi:hypothetical protein
MRVNITYEWDYDTHEFDYDMHECCYNTHECEFNTHKIGLYTQRTMSTRRERCPHVDNDVHTQSVASTHTR